MGYEVARFIDKVDEEFHCSICVMILKDPMQSPCEHLFCNECIKRRLAVDQSCPVDREPIQVDDLKPAFRTFCNFLNKLEIKCDFESKGCAAIVKLENLEDHVDRCEYNSNATVVCDKGCEIKMRREEYKTTNCFKHLADQVVRQQHEIKNQHAMIEKLNDEVVSLRKQQEVFVNQMIRQSDKITTPYEVKSQSTEIRRLNDELNLRGDIISRLNDDLNELRIKEGSKLSNAMLNAANVLVSVQPEFRVWYDMKISIHQSNVLEVDNGSGFAQSVYSLEQTKFSFKIEILSLGRYIRIGLATMLPSDRKPSFHYRYISGFSDGKLYIDGKCTKVLEKWKAGDIIEGGINFPSDFVNDGKRVQFYFQKNGELIAENFVAMPMDVLFPTVDMDKGSKIRYLRN